MSEVAEKIEIGSGVENVVVVTGGEEALAPTSNAQANQPTTVKNYFFSEQPVDSQSKKEVPQSLEEVVNQVINESAKDKMTNDEDTKKKVDDAVNGLIEKSIKTSKSKADKHHKKSFFEANKDACSYFGYDENTTPTAHVFVMTVWSWIINMLYICTVGAFVVFPISFIFHKIHVVIKKSWVVLPLAILIYALVVMTPFFIVWLGRV